jgi:outer membrane murein-binding lipoprotein Lpp
MMDRKKLVIGAAAVAALVLGGGVAIAAQQQEQPKVDEAAAREAALGAVPGQAKETELERGSGAYEVEVLGKDGKLHEVAVSADSGKVLGQEMDDENQGADDQGAENEGPNDDE